MEEIKGAPVSVVQVDGMVLLKIIKHAKDNMPDPVTGQLLGFDVDGRLEITSCFPSLVVDEEEPSDMDMETYQLEMMKCLRKVNVDSNTVGWYQSAYLGDFLNQTLLESQYEYQMTYPNSVVLVYDPFRTASGRLSLKAYRLTPKCMSLIDSGKFTNKNFNRHRVDSTDLLEEVPLKVHNSHLVHGFLYDLRESKTMSRDFDALRLTSNPFLQRNLESLSQCIDDYAGEQSKFQFHQRQVARQKAQHASFITKRNAENDARKQQGKDLLGDEELKTNPLFKPIAAPSRLETYLISNQINQYCGQITSTATEGFSKMYLVEALHKESEERESKEKPKVAEDDDE